VLSVLLAVAAGCTPTAERNPLFERWLAKAGTAADNAELVAEVRANRAVIEGQFIDAFRNGPGDVRHEALNESVERVWSLAQVQLAEPDAYNLDDDDIAELKALSLETEKREAWERLDHNFKAAAMLGLGVTRGSEATAVLAQVAADQTSPFRMLAANALGSE
jgi:hypothetical protein